MTLTDKNQMYTSIITGGIIVALVIKSIQEPYLLGSEFVFHLLSFALSLLCALKLQHPVAQFGMFVNSVFNLGAVSIMACSGKSNYSGQNLALLGLADGMNAGFGLFASGKKPSKPHRDASPHLAPE